MTLQEMLMTACHIVVTFLHYTEKRESLSDMDYF